MYDGFRVLPSRFWCTFTCSISTPQSSKKSYQFSFSKIKPSSGSSQIVVDFTKQKRCFGIKTRISFTKNKIAGTAKPNVRQWVVFSSFAIVYLFKLMVKVPSNNNVSGESGIPMKKTVLPFFQGVLSKRFSEINRVRQQSSIQFGAPMIKDLINNSLTVQKEDVVNK